MSGFWAFKHPCGSLKLTWWHMQITVYVVAIVIGMKNHPCDECHSPTPFFLVYNTVLLLFYTLVAFAAWATIKYPYKR